MNGPTPHDDAPDTVQSARPLRALRADRLLTIRELARLARVAATTIYAIESGERPPGPRVIRRVAAALEVSPDDVAEFRSRRWREPREAAPDEVAARLQAMGYPRVLALRAAQRTK